MSLQTRNRSESDICSCETHNLVSTFTIITLIGSFKEYSIQGLFILNVKLPQAKNDD